MAESQKRGDNETPAEEGLPLWMATFADLVTLLLCFFVLLLSFAQQDANKFKTLAGSVKDAFGIQVKRKTANFAAFSPSKFERSDVKLEKEDQAILGMLLELKSYMLDDPSLQKVSTISADNEGLVLRVPVDSFFAPGSAKLKPGSEALLDSPIKILKEHTVNMVVRGHTSDIDRGNGSYPTNWELSSARAAALLRAIMKRSNLPSTRLKAVGYADSQPLLPNNSDQNRNMNDRMEFYFHRPQDKSW
ncbi:flagellar motor protein MotB [Halodesulfovibrio spirochaetisodalis]|uniref:Flagellar motor protein MotB n=1 Tax=Halodesulfovibrio spirochaetisodalis TaxID=1560234 RepID=A0A1B7X926_9BACT|nr:flagellar motor protein MotB [Halodesulfovibrio spirochaetisodalis]OBQ45856.1 flagellar motor protein MotB [Halodesulfovibrio spirochaetisodalis]